MARPIADRVIIRRKEAKEVVQNGLYIPDNAVEKPQEGEVIAVGNGLLKDGERIKVDVEVGDIVAFNKYAGTELKILNETLLILKEDEILCVL